MINLTTLKASAELAKTSQLNRDEWGEDIDPDEVLRLVEVARAAVPAQRLLKEELLDSAINEADQHRQTMGDYRPKRQAAFDAVVVQVKTSIEALEKALEGIEP